MLLSYLPNQNFFSGVYCSGNLQLEIPQPLPFWLWGDGELPPQLLFGILQIPSKILSSAFPPSLFCCFWQPSWFAGCLFFELLFRGSGSPLHQLLQNSLHYLKVVPLPIAPVPSHHNSFHFSMQISLPPMDTFIFSAPQLLVSLQLSNDPYIWVHYPSTTHNYIYTTVSNLSHSEEINRPRLYPVL